MFLLNAGECGSSDVGYQRSVTVFRVEGSLSLRFRAASGNDLDEANFRKPTLYRASPDGPRDVRKSRQKQRVTAEGGAVDAP